MACSLTSHPCGLIPAFGTTPECVCVYYVCVSACAPVGPYSAGKLARRRSPGVYELQQGFDITRSSGSIKPGEAADMACKMLEGVFDVDVEQVKGWFRVRKNTATWCVWCGVRMVGFLALMRTPVAHSWHGSRPAQWPYIDMYMVDKGFQKRGLGKMLVDVAFKWAEGEGDRPMSPVVAASVHADNTRNVGVMRSVASTYGREMQRIGVYKLRGGEIAFVEGGEVEDEQDTELYIFWKEA